MGWFGNLLGGIGSAVAGWFGYKSSKERNEAQIQAANNQMNYQERMSSTAHQREVADLRAAGLNPMLSLKHGGATSPPGALPNLISTIDGVRQGVSSAKDATDARLINQMVKTEKEKTRHQGSLADIEKSIAKLTQEIVEKKTSKAGQVFQWADIIMPTAKWAAGTAAGIYGAKKFGPLLKMLPRR